MTLSKYELMIISKYFNDIEDYINLMETCKLYSNITELFKFNPIDIPFNNQDELNLYTKIFKNINTIHYYEHVNEFPHFLNPFVIHFDIDYFPELDSLVEKFKNKCKFDKCTLREYNLEYAKNNLGKDIITNISINYMDKNVRNIDLSSYTKLTKIDKEGFLYDYIESIKLPSSIIKIDNQAFVGNNFEEIDLSNCTNLTKLCCGCFENCGLLKTIKLPLSIVEISNDCFKNCDINEIDLSKYTNLTRIGCNCFDDNDLTNIKLPTSLTKLEDNFCGYGEFVIPDSIIELSNYCFENACFTKIVFNSNITSMVNFYNSEIEQIDLSKCVKLKEIDDLTFGKCWYLKEIDLSNCTNLTRLGKHVFYFNLTDLILPTSFIEIDEGCFNCCKDLKEIDLSKCINLTKIADDAFHKDITIKMK